MIFFEAIFAPQNVAFTVLLGFILLYWLAVVFIGVGVELLDGVLNVIDAGLTHTPDIDPTTGLDHGVDAPGPSNFMGNTLRFFNFGDVPATIIITAIVIIAWAGNVLLYPWTNDLPGPAQLGICLAVLVAALFISKLVTSPLKDVFSRTEAKGPERTNLIGCECILTMPASQAGMTTAEAKTPSNRFIVINVRCAPGQGPIPKGARAIIHSLDPATGGYLIHLPGNVPNPPSEGGNTK